MLFIHVVDLHHAVHPLLEGGRDEDTDMRNVVVPENDVGAAAHDDKILFLRHIHDQLALVEEDRVSSGQAVIPEDLAGFLPQGQRIPVLGHARIGRLGHLQAGIALVVLDAVLLRLQPLQHGIEDLRVVIVDL